MKASAHIGKTCLLLHRWNTLKDNGFTVYRECKDCGKRSVTQPRSSSYQPVDWEWLTFKKGNL